MTWQEEINKCAKAWQAKKKRETRQATKTKPKPVPRRLRGKQSDPTNDID